MKDSIQQNSKCKDIIVKPPRTLWGDVWRQFRRHRLAILGTIILVLIILFIIVGPLVYKTDPRKIDFSISLASPTIQHPFGADDLGHDLFARAMWGGRVSMLVGLMAMVLAIIVGTLIGALSGFFGGTIDMLLMRLTEIFIAMPRLPLLMVVIFLFRDTVNKVFGPENGILILIVSVIGLLGWMQTARIVRASFLSAKEKEYVEAAICSGTRTGKLMFKHILPNVFSPIIVSATIGIGSAIMTESSLSFLGLGFPPDTPTWGRMLNDAQNYLDIAPHMALVPGILIFLVVLSINYLGDGLRDALDPQLRSR